MKFFRIVAKFRDGEHVVREVSPVYGETERFLKELALEWLDGVRKQHNQMGHLAIGERVEEVVLP